MTKNSRKWPVIDPYIETITVTGEHLDAFGHTNNVQYLRWLEQVAWNHSIQLGLDFEQYRERGVGCVARRHELDYLAASFVGEELEIGTWVQQNDGRLSMWRGYQINRCSDGRIVLRGKTHWVCVSMSSGRPVRMPADYVLAYQPATPS